MKNRIREAVKTFLIALLFCSLLLLTAAAMPMDMIRSTPWLSGLLQPLAPLLGLPVAELTYVEDAQQVSDAAQPRCISVRNAAGRYSAQWDFDALDAAFETLGGMLGQALDTAGEFTEVSDQQITRALSGYSVCFDYGFSLEVSLLGSWLGAECPETNAAGRRWILAEEDDRVRLYLTGTPSMAAETELSAAALHGLLEQYMPDGSRYAFEAGSHLADLALIPGSDPELLAAVSSSPCDSRYIETLATALGFNPYDETRYTDSAGVTWFSETNCSLQIAASGEIVLTSNSTDRFQADGDSTEVLIEAARTVIQTAVGDILGDARIYLSGIETADDTTVLTFDYVLGGVPVSCDGHPAATVTFAGQSMTSLELLAATFTCTDQPLKILPPAQASAIIPAGSDLVLQYDRAANGTITAGWAKS